LCHVPRPSILMPWESLPHIRIQGCGNDPRSPVRITASFSTEASVLHDEDWPRQFPGEYFDGSMQCTTEGLAHIRGGVCLTTLAEALHDVARQHTRSPVS